MARPGPDSPTALAVAAAPFAFLAAVVRFVPLPPAAVTPTPWPQALGTAALLLAAFWAHTWCYARWQPHAPRRMLANELMARLWFVAYAVVVVGNASPNGFRLLWLAVPWAVLAWEVHRDDVRKNGYRVAWNLGAWGVYLLGLFLLEVVAVSL